MKALLQALAAYGPWGLFLLSVADSAGVPLPAAMDALVIGAAAGSTREPQRAWFIAFMAVLGSVGGNMLLFQASRHGRRILSKGKEASGKRRRFQEWFQRYGLLTVFIPAVVPFIPLPLKVFVISAGAMHTPTVTFFVVILLARVIRYFGEAYLGLQLGKDAMGFLTRNGWTLAGTALAVAVGLVLLIRLIDRGQAKTSPHTAKQAD